MASADSAHKVASGERRQIILFGGHGSTTIFSPVAAKRAQFDSDQSTAASILLSRCHAAFLEECLGLDDWTRSKLDLDLTNFQTPKNLLVPPQSFWKNPVLQATTVCLYQLLRYIAEVERPDSRLDGSGKQILETVGVCAGLLPAAVVATSKSVTDIVKNGVAAFRLGFRIACRSAIHGRGYEGDKGDNESWTLVIIGLRHIEVAEKLESFCIQVSE